MPFLNRGTYQLYYEVIGNGKPLVFLHGLGGSVEQIKNIYYSIPNIQLIVMDQQGHGRSTANMKSLSFAQMAKDVIALADVLELDTFYLAGISMGAAVSIKTKLLFSNRITKLVLIRNAWINSPMSDRFVNLYASVADCLAHNDLHGFMNTEVFCQLKKESHHAAESFVHYFYDEASLHYYEKYKILPKTSPIEQSEELSSILCQTLILANFNDPIHPYTYSEFIAKQLSQSTLYEIESKDIDQEKHKNQINTHLKAFLLSK